MNWGVLSLFLLIGGALGPLIGYILWVLLVEEPRANRKDALRHLRRLPDLRETAREQELEVALKLDRKRR